MKQSYLLLNSGRIRPEDFPFSAFSFRFIFVVVAVAVVMLWLFWTTLILYKRSLGVINHMEILGQECKDLRRFGDHHVTRYHCALVTD